MKKEDRIRFLLFVGCILTVPINIAVTKYMTSSPVPAKRTTPTDKFNWAKEGYTIGYSVSSCECMHKFDKKRFKNNPECRKIMDRHADFIVKVDPEILDAPIIEELKIK